MGNSAKGWTPERRQRQREAIRQWQPWNQSTGPTSTEGKAVASQNAYAGGFEKQLRQLCAAMRRQRDGLQ